MTKLRIDEMFAFVATDPKDNTEGVIGMLMNGVMMPLVGADMTRVDQLRPVARDIGKAQGIAVKLVKFRERIDMGDA